MNRLRLACLFGTAFEYFEFQIFAMLLPFLIENFFSPSIHSTNKFLEGYLAFGVAFLARPLGGLLLGHIGDQYGRRQALLIAMWMMSISTMTIGLLPSFNTIGVAACILLFLCRIVQGLSLGGEYSSGFVFLFEHQKNPKCSHLIWQDLGGATGLFFATLLVMLTTSIFTPNEIQTFAWRLPFLAAFLLSLCGIYIRHSVTNPVTHLDLIKENSHRTKKDYYRQTMSEWPSLVLLTLACAPNGIFWYLQIIFIPNQLLHLNALTMCGLIGLTIIMIPMGAKIADEFGAYRIWLLSVVGLLLNFDLLIIYPNHTIQIIGMFFQAILLAINMGPRLIILNNSFPLAIRAISCSLVYSMANVLGGITPFIALLLFKQSHDAQSLYQILLVFCLLSMISMFFMRVKLEKRKKYAPLELKDSFQEKE